MGIAVPGGRHGSCAAAADQRKRGRDLSRKSPLNALNLTSFERMELLRLLIRGRS